MGKTEDKRLKGRRVAVTGATGLLGRELSRQLLGQEANLRLVVRDRGRLSSFLREGNPGVEVVECGLTNPIELAEAFKDIEVVYNCAAQVSFRFDEVEKIVRTNTDIATHVVNACMNAGVNKLVHVSSIASLGPVPEGSFIDESCYPDTIIGWNGYSVSKYYSENEVWRGYKSGLKTVIVNPSVILGPGDWTGEGSAALFAVAAKGMPFYTDGVTGYVDVRDVARAMIQLSVKEEAVGQRFILSAANLSYKEFFTKAALSVGGKPPKRRAGKKMLAFAKGLSEIWATLTMGQPRLTEGLVKTAQTKSFYSSEAVKDMLDFRFTPIDETIKYMGAEYKKYKTNA